MSYTTGLNRAKTLTATTGQGTVTLGSASAGFMTPAEAGVVNGQEVIYILEEGNDFEIGRGVYSSSGPTITRATVYQSKISGTPGTTKMTLAGNATVTLGYRYEDFRDLVSNRSFGLGLIFN